MYVCGVCGGVRGSVVWGRAGRSPDPTQLAKKLQEVGAGSELLAKADPKLVSALLDEDVHEKEQKAIRVRARLPTARALSLTCVDSPDPAC